MDTQILAPAAALVGWSLIILFWVIATRFPAFAEANLDLSEAAPGTRYGDIESALPAKVNWKSHNFVHLMEQPTLFYATIAILAIAGQGTELNLMLAWGYVGLRVVHSLWQSLVNTIPVRVTLFAVSTLCLTGLAVNAIRATIF